MKLWLVLLAGLGLWWLTQPVPAVASGTFSIGQTFPSDGASNVPVNLITDQHHPTYGYAAQAVSMTVAGLPASCEVDRTTFTQQTVRLTSATDHQTYLLTAPTANLTTSTPWLAIGSPTIGFELLPYTTYSLTLRGGANGIQATCAGQPFYLSQDKTITFTTGADTVAPQILGPQIQTTSTSASFHWETFQAASGQVMYGLSSLNQTASQSGMVTLHTVTAQNLQPGTTYAYQIQSRDAAGNVATSDGHFTTVGLGEVGVTDITDMAATVYWTSNQPTDTIIEYGRTDQYGNRQGNGGQLINHTWRLVGLAPQTTYHFRIIATNSNGSSTFGDNFFTTGTSTAVSGGSIGQTEGASISNDNIKLFPQVSFEPVVLGASRAAAVASNTMAIGRNLLTGTTNDTQKSGWVGWLLWLLPLILLLIIAGIWWHVRRLSRQATT